MDVAAVTVHIAADLVTVFLIQFKIPANRCIIVMGTCVADAVFRAEIRQKIAFCGVIEGKLKHLHTRISGFCQKLPDAVCKESQILCDHIQILNFFLQDLEQFYSRTFFPLSVLSGLISIGN